MDGIILSLILLVPLAGMVLILLLPDRGKLAAWIALLDTLLTFVCTLHLPAHFDSQRAGFQFEENLPWLSRPAIHYHLGVDGLSLWLVVLVGLLAPVGVVASWRSVQKSGKLFYALFLLQQTAMVGVFVSLDLMLYYGFWELSLIPIAVLTAMFGRNLGDASAAKAALRFFLYNFIPSAPLLVALLWLYAHTGTFDYATLQAAIAGGTLPGWQLAWVSVAFLVAFAVKVPVLGLHGWLPDLFSEAPVAIAMIAAGKLGLYSLIRFHVQLFPALAHCAAPWMVALAAVGILYGALLALVQKDFWKLLAYATLGSLSFCTLGIYGFTAAGLTGAVLQTVNEGVIGAALFLLFGVLFEPAHTSKLADFGGLAAKTPRLATLFTLASLALIGLPLLNGFVGEFLVLSGTFTGVSRGWAAIAALGVILSAAYMLSAIQKIFLANGVDGATHAATQARDLTGSETLAVAVLALLMLAIGIQPGGLTDAIQPALQTVTQSLHAGNPTPVRLESGTVIASTRSTGGRQ